MKTIVTIFALITFIIAGVEKPKEAHAGSSSTILVLALIGGAAYGGYYFSENYEVQQRAAVEFDGGNVKFQKPSLNLELSKNKLTAEKKKHYSVALVNFNF